MKLLIVDSDPLILECLELTLSSHDYITVAGVASSGFEALSMCENNKPDAILMDIRMDGIDAIKLIKIRYPNIRIMIITTFYDKLKIEQALSVGADGYLLKTDKVSSIADNLFAMMDGMKVLGSRV